MALNPSTKYPGQVNVSDPAGYPYGRAKNETAPGGRDGTPLEEAWVSDLWGFLQALLSAAGITPSGTADKVGASEYLEGVAYVATHTTFTSAIEQTGASADNSLEGNLDVGGELNVTGGASVTGGSLTADEVVATSLYSSNLLNLSPAISVTRIQPLTPLFNGVNGGGNSSLGTSGGWVFNASGDFEWEGGGDNLVLPLINLVDNSTLTAVTLRVSGSSAGCSAKLYTDDNSTSVTLLETQADAGSGVRDLTITVSPAATINLTTTPRALYVLLDNPASGYKVHRMTATFLATKTGPG